MEVQEIMTTILLGMGLLLLTLAGFSLFSMKAPKGSLAMSGLANAAVATFLVEAVHKYISGDLMGFAFLGEAGSVAGSMGGVAAAILVPIGMGANPVFAVVAGVAVGVDQPRQHGQTRAVDRPPDAGAGGEAPPW